MGMDVISIRDNQDDGNAEVLVVLYFYCTKYRAIEIMYVLINWNVQIPES